MYKKLQFPVLAGLVLAGCASSQAEEVRDARQAGIDAQTENEQKAIEDRADVRSDHIEQRHDSIAHRVEASDRPGEDANEKLVSVSKERAQYESQAVSRLNALAARINGAQQKLQVLGPQAPIQLKTELDTTAQQYALLKHDVMKLKSVPAESWEATTQELDRRVDMLDDRVSKLDEAIEDV